MKKTFSYIINILSGREQLADRHKYKFMVYSVACVHSFLLCVFLYLNITPLYLFNIASVLTYLFAAHLAEKEHYLAIYFITYFEIVLHSFIATLCLGWKFGFAQYIIAIVPVGYFVCYALKTGHRQMLIATQSALLAAAFFLSCKILSYHIEPFYPYVNHSWEVGLYFFNSLCTFSFLTLFSLVYIAEIRFTSTRLQHQNAILEQLAYTDPLTGLYNRRSMHLFIDQALKLGSGFSLIMCDIDDFKKVNDTYGHDFGDVVLHDIAQIAVNTIQDNGYVCRWGGEEILILISATREKTIQLAELLRRGVSQHVFKSGSEQIRCTLTLGVASHEKGKSAEETISAADNHLYEGKRSGKNKVVA